MIYRYSSRRSPLKDFLATQLQGAHRYDRIAGFFSSSLLEVAGEALEQMAPKLRVATSESEKAALQNAVTTTDAEIDCLVYELYGLTEEEIKIVEGER